MPDSKKIKQDGEIEDAHVTEKKNRPRTNSGRAVPAGAVRIFGGRKKALLYAKFTAVPDTMLL